MTSFCLVSILLKYTVKIVDLYVLRMELSNLSSSIVRVGSKSIPAIGFGTYLLKGETGLKAMKHAIKVGYRHIDTAHLYDNEEIVGQAVKQSIAEGVLKSRDEIFITSKLGTIWHDPKKIPKVVQVREGSLDFSL